MNYIYLGKIVNTHGIKGEVRILSNFDKKNLVFKRDFKIYIGENKEEKIINSYRQHKNFDMVTFEGINDINEVLKYKGSKVYINKEDLNLKEEEYILDDLLGMKIIENNTYYGIVEDIFDNHGNTLLAISFEKNYYIPYNSKYIKEINLQKQQIIVEKVKDLIL